MAIEFRCEHCNRLLRTPDDAAGKQARCPDCSAISTVPQQSEGGPPSSAGGSPLPAGGYPAAENPYQSPTRNGAPYPPHQPPHQPPPPIPVGSVPNYLAQAILCTLFCCVPFGIVAIIFAAQVNTRLIEGNYAAARQMSNNAQLWCWISLGSGLVLEFLIMMMCGGVVFG